MEENNDKGFCYEGFRAIKFLGTNCLVLSLKGQAIDAESEILKIRRPVKWIRIYSERRFVLIYFVIIIIFVITCINSYIIFYTGFLIITNNT